MQNSWDSYSVVHGERNVLTGDLGWDVQKPKAKSNNETRKEGLKVVLTWQSVPYPARLRLTPNVLPWHHPRLLLWPCWSALRNFWYLIFSLVAKIHADCSHLPHNVLHLPCMLEIWQKAVDYILWCQSQSSLCKCETWWPGLFLLLCFTLWEGLDLVPSLVLYVVMG